MHYSAFADELKGEESDTSSTVPSESEGKALDKAYERIHSIYTFFMREWTMFNNKNNTGSRLILAGSIPGHTE